MAANQGGRAGRGDRTGQCIAHGGGLSALRNTADPRIGCKQAGAGNCDGSPWHRVEVNEMALAHLLAATCRVELNDLHGDGIIEIRGWWIIEGDVAVFTEAYKGNVDRSSGHQR